MRSNREQVINDVKLFLETTDQRPLELPSHSVHVTCSAGAALCSPDSLSQDWFQRADLAMYQAKDLGGNQAVILASR